MYRFNKKELQVKIMVNISAKEGKINKETVISKILKQDNEVKDWFDYIAENEGIDEIKTWRVIKIDNKLTSDIIVKINDITIPISLIKQNESGYNHLKRGSVSHFAKLFGFSKLTKTALMKYCGVKGHSPYDHYQKGKITKQEYMEHRDIPDKVERAEGTGRYYFDELETEERASIRHDFDKNIRKILTYALRGDESKAKYIIVTKKEDGDVHYHIDSVENVVEKGIGQINATNRGSFRIGQHITVQRKGGTWGATQLQFKWRNIFQTIK